MRSSWRASRNCKHASQRRSHDVDNDSVLAQLNGAFAVLLADETGFSIVVDPLGFTQVFLAEEGKGNVLAVGTHAETVAIAGDVSTDIDLISAVQFLRHGHCLFPNTMYKDLTECQAGTVHVMDRQDDEDNPSSAVVVLDSASRTQG